MHLSRPVIIRVAISAALTVVNLWIGASVLHSTANQAVFPVVIVLVLLSAVTLAQVWRRAIADRLPATPLAPYLATSEISSDPQEDAESRAA